MGDTLNELIAKLEAAKDGSWELGDEVLLACGWKTTANFDPANPHPYWIRPDGVNVGINQPDPTTSLDAALTLVPDSYQWSVTDWRVKAYAQIGATISSAEAAAPALALCIAALKARAEHSNA